MMDLFDAGVYALGAELPGRPTQINRKRWENSFALGTFNPIYTAWANSACTCFSKSNALLTAGRCCMRS